MNNEKHIVYSLDDETFDFDDEDEVIQAALDNEQTIYYQGEVKPVLPKHLISANDVIGMLPDRAWDIAGDVAEDYALDISKEASKELEEYLHKWVDKHVPIYFYLVENVQCIVIDNKQNI